MDKGQSHTETNKGMHPFVTGRSFAVLVATILFCMLAFNLLKKKKKKRASTPLFISPLPTGVGSDHYDVFLSFRGSDTRKGFTDHLYHGLVKAGIVPVFVFRDDKSIPIGEEFGSQILDAIARSKISIPIISENYASSKWCLRELIHIMDRTKSTSRIVLPIFYKVDPSDVRHLKGSFGEAFHSRKKYFDNEDIQKGQQALEEVSNLHGWESEKVAKGHEGELVEKVIENVVSKLRQDFQLDVTKHLVGIGDHVNKIENWVNTPITDAPPRMIGIYGMGGIGKTTLAKVIYNQLSNDFVHRSFLANIRETACRNGIPYLQKQLIKEILQIEPQVWNVDDGINIIKSGFGRKKVLILLDDIDDKNQLNWLVRERNWFMAGSMIIVTTRNEAVLDQFDFKVDYKYELYGLDEVHALLLFNKHAFRMDHSPEGFKGISRDIISTMGGLPLALEVVGAYLYKKTNRKLWEDVRKQLERQPHKDVQKILQISYDALEEGHKQIFLDIVCFFIGESSKFAIHMWEGCGLYPNQGIEELKLRCLIKFRDDGEFEMHDQLRDLGRSILCEGQPPEKRSGPWDNDYKGVTRVLREHESPFSVGDWMRAASSGGSNELLSEVRWLQWCIRGSDSSLLTTNLHLLNLSVLELGSSDITEDWEGWSLITTPKRLQVLDLEDCDGLRCTPDLSAFTQLKILTLSGCEELQHLHPSVGKLTSLVSLDLSMCGCLKELPEEVGELKDLEELVLDDTGITKIPTSIGSLRKLKTLSALRCESLREIPSSIWDLQNLQHLDLSCCKSLKELPEVVGGLKDLEELLLGWSGITEIPTSIGSLRKLKKLRAICCMSLREIPSSIGDLQNLQHLNLCYCKSLREIPSSIGDLQNLQHLDLSYLKSLKELPEEVGKLKDLEELVLAESGITEIPTSIGSLTKLKTLNARDCKSLREIPSSIGNLQNLQHLDLSYLKSLKELPEEVGGLKDLEELLLDQSGITEIPTSIGSLRKLKKLSAVNCKSLREIPSSIGGLQSLRDLGLAGCYSLTGAIPSEIGDLSSLESLDFSGTPISDLPESIRNLSSLQSLRLSRCDKLRSLPELPSGLTDLWVSCQSPRLPHLSSLIHLEELYLKECHPLEDIPKLKLDGLKNLEMFSIGKCSSIKRLDLSQLIRLKNLNVEDCNSLVEIQGQEKLEFLEGIFIDNCNSIKRLLCPESGCLKRLAAVKCNNLVEIRGLDGAKFLEELNFMGCESMEMLPNLTGCEKLRSLNVRNCKKLTQLGGFEKLDLIDLDIFGCDSLEAIPKLS